MNKFLVVLILMCVALSLSAQEQEQKINVYMKNENPYYWFGKYKPGTTTLYAGGGIGIYEDGNLHLTYGGGFQNNHMVLTPGHKVGIGTNKPPEMLTLSKKTGTLAFAVMRGSKYVVRLGSGTSDSGTKGILCLHNNGDDKIRLYTQGPSYINDSNLGLGTKTPRSHLHIKNVRPQIIFTGTEAIASEFAIGEDEGKLRFTRPDHETYMVIQKNGNVGIGTDKPTTKLAVKGAIVAQRVIVSLDKRYWPDFVFNKGYKLRSLEEVEKHIEKKKNLPDIPTIKDIAKGVNLGQMQAKLLQKIEELTLYTIAQEKKSNCLKNHIGSLKNANGKLQKQVDTLYRREEKLLKENKKLKEHLQKTDRQMSLLQQQIAEIKKMLSKK